MMLFFFLPIRKTYEKMALNTTKYDEVYFDDDRMVVDQVLFAKNMTLTIESKSDFSAGFDAKAQATNELGLGVKYKKLSERSYEYELKRSDPYLIAIGGVQADKYVD